MSKVMVIAPHPDDETLGCGGSLLKHKQAGDEIIWVIVTSINEELGFSPDRIAQRQDEIKSVGECYGFSEVIQLNFPTTQLDQVSSSALVSSMGRVISRLQPEIIYLPYRGDVHTDHKYVFDAAVSCTKWFRYPSIKRVLVYETLSETEFGINPDINAFRPNSFVNISEYLERKIEILNIFKSEMSDFPFPRSNMAVDSLAKLRGATAGFYAAEAFMLLKEIQQ